MINYLPSGDELLKISEHIKPYIHRTPVISSSFIDKYTGSHVLFKCENFQKTGSFKIRGTANAILNLNKDQLSRGVITHSSGNFAQALAYVAARLGTESTIIMPENSVQAKVSAVKFYGGKVIFCGKNPEDRIKKCNEVKEKTHACFIHPYDDINVIGGHASCAIEMIKDCERLDYVFVPVGGGGLASGICLGFNCISSHTKVIGVEPEGADDAYRSLNENRLIPQTNPKTIADGLRTSLGNINFQILKKYLAEIITVNDSEIINAMKLIWDKLKIVAEPSGSVSLAGLIKHREKFKGSKTGVIISGGNIDISKINL
jgi:threonine dehydratase